MEKEDPQSTGTISVILCVYLYICTTVALTFVFILLSQVLILHVAPTSCFNSLYKYRHDCLTFDVNKDGLKDIICVVGAFRGQGLGYNELCESYKESLNYCSLMILLDPFCSL